MIIMAYNGVSITTTVSSATKDSHCIPAYPQYNSSTNFNAAYYTSRKATNNTLAGSTIPYVVQS